MVVPAAAPHTDPLSIGRRELSRGDTTTHAPRPPTHAKPPDALAPLHPRAPP